MLLLLSYGSRIVVSTIWISVLLMRPLAHVTHGGSIKDEIGEMDFGEVLTPRPPDNTEFQDGNKVKPSCSTVDLSNSPGSGKLNLGENNLAGQPVLKGVSNLAKYSYASPYELHALAQLELSLYPIIKTLYPKYKNQTGNTSGCGHTKEFNQNIDLIKSFLEEFEQFAMSIGGSLDTASLKPETISQNPLAAYKLIDHFLNFLQVWIRETPADNWISFCLGKIYNISDGPTTIDLEFAMFAILNIQLVYDLTVKDVSAGVIDGADAKVRLKARDCYMIGNQGVAFKWYLTGIEWLEYALHLVNNSADNSVMYDEVNKALLLAKISRDTDARKPVRDDSLKDLFYKHFNEVRQTQASDRITKKSIYSLVTERKNPRDGRFCAVCNGKLTQTNKEKSSLFCWYEREVHPSYKIGPLKWEFISMYPGAEVVQVHDIISVKDMESLKNFASRDYEVPHEKDIHRVGKFMKQNESEASIRIGQLVNRVTGLETISKEQRRSLKILAYAPGGFSGNHVDLSFSPVATFILYLSDVAKGGETIFVNNAVKCNPKKGSGIFWYNRFSCGAINQMTEHGGCPVVFGIKWVAIQLTFYPTLLNRLQCHMEPLTSHEILVNGKSKYI